MKNQINHRIKFFVFAILAVLLINIVISYAYIRGNSINNESISTVALTGGTIFVRFTNNSDNIVVNDIVPGFETTKSFTITSDFGSNHQYYQDGIWYTVAMIIEKNEFDDNAIVCTLIPDDTSDNDGILALEYDVPLPSGAHLDGVSIGSGKFESDNKIHKYTLKISYPENGKNQSHMVNSIFQAHVAIINPKQINIEFDLDGGTLTDLSFDTNYSLRVPSNYVMRMPTPSKNENIFMGWIVEEGNGEIEDNILKVYDESVKVTALWSKNYPNYTFLKSDGTNANHLLILDSTENWRIKFLESGTLTINDLGNAINGIDIFMVGGGGGASYGGGGGGYTKTISSYNITESVYEIIVGAGGEAGINGSYSSGFGYTVSGGNANSDKNGGAGGSGGGGMGAGWYDSDAGWLVSRGGAGGSDGSDGATPNKGGTGGIGQKTTTREFGEENGTLYAGGGGGRAGCHDGGCTSGGAGGEGGGGAGGNIQGTNGEENTGGGGGGVGGIGGSGIVIIRNHRV